MDPASRIRTGDIAVDVYKRQVYNSGGYDSVDTLRLLDGVIDIYMPDAKYGRDDVAFELSHAQNYTSHMKAALVEMHRQVRCE